MERKARPDVLIADQEFKNELEIPGINHEKVNINGKGFERTLLWRLSWWNIM